MRIIFMGTPDFAVPTLTALHEAAHEIVAVYTQPPRRAGRGKKLQPSAVQKEAEALGIEVRSPTSLKTAEEQEAFAALNPDIAVTVQNQRFGTGSAPSGNILIDATDNFETRFALNRLAHETGRYLVSGAASRWSGQVSTYASGVADDAPCYKCFVPDMPPAAEACDDVGVVGALTGIVGTHMALEAIKLIVGTGRPLIGRLLIIDGLSSENRILKLRPNPDCSVCGG